MSNHTATAKDLAAAVFAAREARFKHSLMRTTVSTDAPTRYECVCGETLTAKNEPAAHEAWDEHRRERYNAALRDRDPEEDAELVAEMSALTDTKEQQ